MTVLLIASFANDLEIPCRIFPDIETGKKRCDEIFGFKGKEVDNDRFVWSIDLDNGTDKSEEISDELFTHHYYGNGGPDMFGLSEIQYDTKFLPFDLD